MKLAIVGHGKMGRLIEQLSPAYHCEVALRLDLHNNAQGEGITATNFAGIDVAIEFSTPATVVRNIERLADLGVHTVVGTTGWLDHLHAIRDLVTSKNIGLVWSPNFSIGINVFQRVVAEAARLLTQLSQQQSADGTPLESRYEAWAWEIHHSAKQDAPSGTLLKLVEEMRNAGWNQPVDQASNRAGHIPGTHEIGFDSAADTITLRHTARNREGFARGALHAAQWIAAHKGFYEFREILFK